MPTLVNHATGQVSIMILAPGRSVEEEFASWPKRTKERLGAIVSYSEVPSAAIPADRTFRAAWRADGTKVAVHMPTAREIRRGHLRAMRAPKLAALDVEYHRADEAGDFKAKAEIAKRKQALRDVTDHPLIEQASTPEELKAVIPDALK